jgi:hypothetical protein
MSAEKIERQDRILAELSELGLELARDLQARALAADDVAVAADLGRAFHSVSRSVRQTLALDAKLERDRQRQDREDRIDAVRAHKARADRRKAQVRAAVERCIWNEAEGSEAEHLLSDLDDYLDADDLTDTFAGGDPIEAHIARLCADLGVTPPTPPPFSSPGGGPRNAVEGERNVSDPSGNPPPPPYGRSPSG